MKNARDFLVYAVIIGGASFLVYWIILHGEHQAAHLSAAALPPPNGSSWGQFQETLLGNLHHPLAILLLQVITILFAARLFGMLCAKIGQPTVIGEIAAGIFLGPSFVGMHFPAFSAFLFPEHSLANLQFLSQIGLILFMFVIGMELDLNVLKNKASEAVVVSHASIVFPFLLGAGLAYFMYDDFAPEGTRFTPFALFMGIAMSITAFPVLARIAQERELSKTRLGTVVMTCAAADDITAWCLLAAVIAITKAGTFVSSLYTILAAGVYVAVMFGLVRPFLGKLGDIYAGHTVLSKPAVAIIFMTLLLSAYATEIIGIHALFGAFMAGIVMPPDPRFRNLFIEKVEDVSLVLLLPLFFVFTGLRTQIGLLNEPALWAACALIILVAVAGKFAGSAFAARLVGQGWRESLIIGTLMNTRGLMELVVLNIGFDLGAMTAELFAMMVIMALATTLMTGPALDAIEALLPEEEEAPPPAETEPDLFPILIAFAHPERGQAMLRLANSLIRKKPQPEPVTALHVPPSNEIHPFNALEMEERIFQPVRMEATRLNVPLIPLFKPALDVDNEIIETANDGDYCLLLVGIGQSVFEGTLLGKALGLIIKPERLYDAITGRERLFGSNAVDQRVRRFIRESRAPVGILFDKHLSSLDNAAVALYSAEDAFLLSYGRRLVAHSGCRLAVLDPLGIIEKEPALAEELRALKRDAADRLTVIAQQPMPKDLLHQTDLVLLSLKSWTAAESQRFWLSALPSLLVLNKAPETLAEAPVS